MHNTLHRPPDQSETQPSERTQLRLITRVAVGLFVAKCAILTWMLLGRPAGNPFGRGEVLFMVWTAVCFLYAGTTLIQDLMVCPRVRQARVIFRLGMQAERLRGR